MIAAQIVACSFDFEQLHGRRNQRDGARQFI